MARSYERHAHAGSGIHNHLHRTTADGSGGRLHAHRYTARGPWVGCDCDRCQTFRARADRLRSLPDLTPCEGCGGTSEPLNAARQCSSCVALDDRVDAGRSEWTLEDRLANG